ncbi:hypothetical protein QY049_17765 [Bradyrhizobium sp. WYCCWR 13022]|uniref:hypothetical protein n=1 Tax=unclassified Bradyrhizobium TaxID=2631580 RepID=UPI00263AC65C|nr:hypothetical protein [Bradyrhizobium sp. WYCCWR 13022]MDN4985056.1 hypothetical protein [Bradyrhizobium sp. WYCCWR 13022]
MRAAWKILWPSAITLAAAVGLAHLLVPDVVPVGYAEQPQASWAILTAFVLRAIALTAAWVAIITLTLLIGARLHQMLFRADRARSDRTVMR